MSKISLTKNQKILVKNQSSIGCSASQIAAMLGISMHDAYNSDDFCIAFSEGRPDLQDWDDEIPG